MKREKETEIILTDKDYELELAVDEILKEMEKETEEKRKLEVLKKNKTAK